MRGMYFGNLDIDLFLTLREFDSLCLLDFNKEKSNASISYRPLECLLEDDIGANRKVHLQLEDFKTGGNDGIKVDFEKDTYYVKINDYAHELIEQRGEFGTRYGMGEKITFYINKE